MPFAATPPACLRAVSIGTSLRGTIGVVAIAQDARQKKWGTKNKTDKIIIVDHVNPLYSMTYTNLRDGISKTGYGRMLHRLSET